jgi:hypothetical protein
VYARALECLFVPSGVPLGMGPRTLSSSRGPAACLPVRDTHCVLLALLFTSFLALAYGMFPFVSKCFYLPYDGDSLVMWPGTI